ncbi:MAG: Lrp/AsnC family transcriptional regulator [Pseudomonadota bacterium]
MQRGTTDAVELDERDRRILELLQHDGRMSNADLSERVNLSPSACLRRVKRLEDLGVIDRYVALLGRTRLGRAGTAFLLIRMERQSRDLFKQFERAIVAIPEVLEVHLIAGDADYIVKMAYRDAQDFERLYFEDLMNLPGVIGTQTKLSLRSVYSDTALRLSRP